MAAETTSAITHTRSTTPTDSHKSKRSRIEAQQTSINCGLNRSGSMRKLTSSSPLAATAGVRVVGYIRVSTDMQAQEGISLDAQRAKLAAYCFAQELTLVQPSGYAGKGGDLF